jgi:uncharacterized lipoprotein
MKKLVITLAVSTICYGCAFTPQAVRVTPELNLTNVMNGSGKAIKVTVVDERSSKSLGQRGARDMGADLTVQGDLTNIVESAIKTGLEKQGFSSSSNEGKFAKLKVEIRNLDYKVITGFWSGTIRSECGVKAICKSSSGNEYEKLYNGLFEKSVQVVANEQENNEYVSAAVSDAVNKLLNDNGLGRCLAE